jgi:hypothetical protein
MKHFIFDDQPIKETLDGVPLSEPAVMKFIRKCLMKALMEVRQKYEQSNQGFIILQEK